MNKDPFLFNGFKPYSCFLMEVMAQSKQYPAVLRCKRWSSLTWSKHCGSRNYKMVRKQISNGNFTIEGLLNRPTILVFSLL